MTTSAGQRLAVVLDLEELSQIEIQPVSSRSPVSEAAFRELLARCVLVSPPAGLADPFSYAPWFRGTFQLRGRSHRFDCFHGNRCRITLPSGEVLVVDAKER